MLNLFANFSRPFLKCPVPPLCNFQEHFALLVLINTQFVTTIFLNPSLTSTLFTNFYHPYLKCLVQPLRNSKKHFELFVNAQFAATIF